MSWYFDTNNHIAKDLEYSKPANPQITAILDELLLGEFIDELIFELKAVFNISINRSHIVDLDSSTKKKFSRHLILHLPSAKGSILSEQGKEQLFQDAPSVGIFVKNFVARMAEEQATGILKDRRPFLAKYLFVETCASPGQPVEICKEKDVAANQTDFDQSQGVCDTTKMRENSNSKQTCFIDTGVYTRNRLFRLIGSKKFGKPSSAALRIASANQFPFPQGFGNEIFYVPEIGSSTPKVSKDNMTRRSQVDKVRKSKNQNLLK